MEIFGIGLPELILIFIIMLIVLGPRDMVKAGRKLGMFIRQVIQSPTWMSMMNATREIRELPTRMVREAGLDQDLQELNRESRKLLDFTDLKRPLDPPTSQFQSAPQAVPVHPDGAGDDAASKQNGGKAKSGQPEDPSPAQSTDRPLPPGPV
jgi:Sec-independent protein translocase protein TatA